MFLVKFGVLLICVISGCFGGIKIFAPPKNSTLDFCIYNGLKLKSGESNKLVTCEELICESDYSMTIYMFVL